MKYKIGHKIFTGYAIAFIALSALSIGSFLSVKKLEANFAAGQVSRDLVDQLDSFHDFIIKGQQGHRVFLLGGDETHLAPLRRVNAEIDTHLQKLQTAADHGNLDISSANLSERSQRLLAAYEKEEQAFRNGDTATLTKSVNESLQMITELEKVISVLQNQELEKFNALQISTSASAIQLEQFIILGSLLALVVVGIAGYVVTRNITVPIIELEQVAARMAEGDLMVRIQTNNREDELGSLSRSFEAMITSLTTLIQQVQRSGVQVRSSAVEISATAKEQQTTAGEVATTTTEISATAKEMSATSSELLKTANSVSMVAEEASSLASSGKEGLQRMETIMAGILEAAAGITSKLGVMNEKAGNINTVVTTITKVADQTNLLSLNAAIEAEKAGEYGRGFAVVATEIRRLADQTAASTSDIEQMVKEMVSAVSGGVMGMDKFAEELRRGAAEITSVGSQLDKVIDEVQSLAPNIESVNEGMRSQTLGAQQISEALSQLGDAARLTADSIKDSARAIEQLNEATQGLQDGIANFKLPA